MTSWGLLPVNTKKVTTVTAQPSGYSLQPNSLAVGARRSYGDVCTNSTGFEIDTSQLSHFIAFDESTGELVVEAGVSLRDIQRHFVPRGWALPVTPGTQFITVGGAIANDVHGKSHHVHGTFAHHVVNFTLLRSSGDVLECSPTANPKYFAATIGGIGLTGLILHATLQLEKVAGPWIDTKTYAFSDTNEFFALSDEVDSQWSNSVAWIDCTSRGGGKGLLMAGNRSADSTPAKYGNPLPFPITPPMSLVNPLTVKALNLGYYAMNRIKPSTHREHYEKFFYPLDSIDNWNRAYGRQGFYQYQSVIPMENAQAATAEMLRVIKRSHQGSFLAVLKKFGTKKSLGMLSFPLHGATVALDFPNRGELTTQLFDSLDSIVKSAGGRLYLAKDARMSRAFFESSYDNISTFTKYRDPAMSSDMSRRLLGN